MNEEMKSEMVVNVDAVTTEENTGTQSEEVQREAPEPVKKYTDKDVDRIVAKKIAAERKRMSKLFETEQQTSEIEQRERNVLLRELKADAKDLLVDRGFPSALSSLLNYSSKEAMEQSIDEVGAIFNDAVQRCVRDKLRGSTPIGYRGTGGTKETDREKALHDAFVSGARTR